MFLVLKWDTILLILLPTQDCKPFQLSEQWKVVCVLYMTQKRLGRFAFVSPSLWASSDDIVQYVEKKSASFSSSSIQSSSSCALGSRWSLICGRPEAFGGFEALEAVLAYMRLLRLWGLPILQRTLVFDLKAPAAFEIPETWGILEVLNAPWILAATETSAALCKPRYSLSPRIHKTSGSPWVAGTYWETEKILGFCAFLCLVLLRLWALTKVLGTSVVVDTSGGTLGELWEVFKNLSRELLGFVESVVFSEALRRLDCGSVIMLEAANNQKVVVGNLYSLACNETTAIGETVCIS